MSVADEAGTGGEVAVFASPDDVRVDQSVWLGTWDYDMTSCGAARASPHGHERGGAALASFPDGPERGGAARASPHGH
ncbi:MAG TPA: hypothetical protein ENH10_02525 [Bacteroidetes bacterium]|nr:hypothetical protein [Bacteroidota bacterium]HEX04015.1 hypothetical protein [Bacteroidota bacterium]